MADQDEPAAPAYLALLDVLRCPHCRGTFASPSVPTAEELVCTACHRAYPVRGGIPVLLVDEARLPEGEPGGSPDGEPDGEPGSRG